MSAKPNFFKTPIRFLKWAAHEKPVYFWSTVIGAMGPVSLVVVPPIRYRLGDLPREKIPLTYPIPPGPRKIPDGFDDP